MTAFLVIGPPARQDFLDGYALGLKHSSQNEEDTFEVVTDVDCPPDTIYIVDKERYGDALQDFNDA